MVKDRMTKLICKIFDEEKALHINMQREKLYAFDKELVTYTAMYPGFLKILFGSIAIIVLMFPYQSIIEEETFLLWMIMMFCTFPAYFGFRASVMIRDDNVGATARVYKKLMYLPIDKKVWVCVKMEYVLKFSIKFCTIALVVQNVMALLICKDWSWANVVYPLVATLIVPMLFTYMDMWTHVKSCETK